MATARNPRARVVRKTTRRTVTPARTLPSAAAQEKAYEKTRAAKKKKA